MSASAIDGERGGRWRDRLVLATSIAGAAVLALALLVASLRAIVILPGLVRAGWREPGLAVVLVALGAGAIVALVGALLAEQRGRWRLALSIGFAAVVVPRVLAIGLLESPLVSDWQTYFELATGMLDGLGFWSSRPPGYPLALAATFALGGRSALAGEVLNLLVAVAVGVLLVRFVEPRFGRSSAIVAVFLYALIPSQVLFSVLLATETLYAGLVVWLAVLAVRAVGGGPGWAIGLGIVFGLAQYVRPTSPYLLAAAVVLFFLYSIGLRRATILAATTILAFALVSAPIVAWNATQNHRLSVSPYLYDNWILYVGLSVEHDGRFNHEDDQRVARATGRLALERIRTNGIDTLLMQPAKFQALWSRADQPSHWIFRLPVSAHEARAGRLLSGISQLGWVVILAGALVAVVARLRGDAGRPTPPRSRLVPEVGIVLLFILASSAIHVVAQVNQRFHEHYVPLICALAAVGWSDLARWLPRHVGASRAWRKSIPNAGSVADRAPDDGSGAV